MVKEVNHDYFNSRSENMYYVLGAFYGCYTPNQDEKAITFRSDKRDLVYLIKKQLETKHSVIKTEGKKSYHLELRSSGIYESLEGLCVNASKNEREFPEMKKRYMRHFARGFFDAKAKVSYSRKHDRVNTIINYSENSEFLKDLHDVFAKYAGVKAQPKMASKAILSYGHYDSLKIGKWLYSGNGLHQKRNKRILTSRYDIKYKAENKGGGWMKKQGIEKITHAKLILAKNPKISGQKLAEKVGYATPFSLYRNFKHVEGMTFAHYKRII